MRASLPIIDPFISPEQIDPFLQGAKHGYVFITLFCSGDGRESQMMELSFVRMFQDCSFGYSDLRPKTWAPLASVNNRYRPSRIAENYAFERAYSEVTSAFIVKTESQLHYLVYRIEVFYTLQSLNTR